MDEHDKELSESYSLPMVREGHTAVNLPLAAFAYLMRRLTVRTLLRYDTVDHSHIIFYQLCPQYCLVCHQQLKEDLDALKPYVCSNPLCTYQYYNLNRGPSLEVLLFNVMCRYDR